MSDTVTEYYTVHVDGEELGRLYSGDWLILVVQLRVQLNQNLI